MTRAPLGSYYWGSVLFDYFFSHASFLLLYAHSAENRQQVVVQNSHPVETLVQVANLFVSEGQGIYGHGLCPACSIGIEQYRNVQYRSIPFNTTSSTVEKVVLNNTAEGRWVDDDGDGQFEVMATSVHSFCKIYPVHL
jgi:hypothetical protein